MRSASTLAALLCAAAMACEVRGVVETGARAYGGENDAGPSLDGGANDAGSVPDAGENDAGPSLDGGASDGGASFDAGAGDGGASPDAGSSSDAGTDLDGGLSPPDAGSACAPRTPSGSEAVALQINAAHTGAQPADALTLPLCRRWTRTFGAPSPPPVISGGRVFVSVGAAEGNGAYLYALDLLTGATLWGPVDIGSTSTHEGGVPILAFDSGRIYLVRGGSLAEAFDASSGAPLWQTQLPPGYGIDTGSIGAGPVVADGIMFATADYSDQSTIGLFALDGTTGALLWARGVLVRPVTPTAGGGSVFVSTECLDDEFYAADGGLAWEDDLGSCFGGRTTPLANGSFFVDTIGSGGSYGAVLDAQTGVQTGTVPFSQLTPVILGDEIVFGSETQLTATDLSGTQMLWSVPFATYPNTSDYVLAAPIAIGRQLAVQTSADLVILDSASGQTLASDDLTDLSMSIVRYEYLQGMAEADGVLVVPVGNSLVAY